MARVRGSTILGTLDYVRQSFGPAAPARLYGALSESVQKTLGDETARHVITTGWYECEKALEVTLGATLRPSIREDAHLAPDPSGRSRTFCRYVAEWGA
jgi:hypothetical protein